jgi:hypothetical protein
MQKFKTELVAKTLESLRSKTLNGIENDEGKLYLSFGELASEPEYILKISTQFRFTLRQFVLLGKQDMFWSSYAESHKEYYTTSSFDCFRDETKFDEQIERFFSPDVIGDYIVRDVSVGNFGDFTITFKNEARLEVKANIFGNDEVQELWRMFEVDDVEADFIVTSLGISDNDDEIGGEDDD